MTVRDKELNKMNKTILKLQNTIKINITSDEETNRNDMNILPRILFNNGTHTTLEKQNNQINELNLDMYEEIKD